MYFIHLSYVNVSKCYYVNVNSLVTTHTTCSLSSIIVSLSCIELTEFLIIPDGLWKIIYLTYFFNP